MNNGKFCPPPSVHFNREFPYIFVYCFSCRYLVELGLRQLDLPVPILVNPFWRSTKTTGPVTKVLGFKGKGSSMSFNPRRRLAPAHFDSVTVRGWNCSSGSNIRHPLPLMGRGFALHVSTASPEGCGFRSAFGPWTKHRF